MVGAMMMIVKDRYKILIAAASAVVLIWFLDAAYHAFISHEGPFLAILSQGTLREPLIHLVLAVGFLIVGIMAVRFNIVVPPLLPPVIEGYPWNDYLPTPVEWGVSAFFIAGGMLVYSLVATWLPIHDPDPADEPEPLADRPTAHAEEVTA